MKLNFKDGLLGTLLDKLGAIFSENALAGKVVTRGPKGTSNALGFLMTGSLIMPHLFARLKYKDIIKMNPKLMVFIQ